MAISKILDFSIGNNKDGSQSFQMKVEDNSTASGYRKYGIRVGKETQDTFWYVHLFRAWEKCMMKINGLSACEYDIIEFTETEE